MHVEFVDQTLRDGQQSLWGLRMRAHHATPILEELDKTGFRVVDLTGPGMMTVLLRQFRDDYWASTDQLVAGLAGNVVRAGMRTITTVGFGFTPDCIIDLYIKTSIRHGVTSFWIYDCLFGMESMRKVAGMIVDAGGQAVPTVMYGLTPVHDDTFFAARAAEMASWPGIEVIELEDAPGVLTPERAATLLPAVRAAVPETPIELHAHNTTGLAPLVYIEGLKAGIDILHTAARSMANGVSLPSTEGMLDILDALGHTHRLDVSRLAPVSEHFARLAGELGYETGVPAEYNLAIYQHQLPGGMTGTLKSQLAQHGMSHRLDEVLREIPRVREDLGEPIMATPFSQFVGIQAVLNVVTGERYKLVPDEVIQYALGHYGPLMRPVQTDVADRILGSPRAAEFDGWERPQPSLAEIRSRFPRTISDEELLLRYMHSDEEVDAMLNDGPVPEDPRRSSSEIVRHVAELLTEARSHTSVRITQPGLSLSMRRRAPVA